MRKMNYTTRIRTMLPLVLLALVLVPAGRASCEEDTADLILTHGVFYPVEPGVPVEGSLAIRNGRIQFLGSAEEAARYRGEGTEVIDLAGRTVTPGLIDAHAHLAGLGAALLSVDLVGTESFDAVIQRIAAAAAELPQGAWVRGRGWDQNDWPVEEFPHHGALSRAVPDHPVWVNRIDGHAALLNRRAMELLGVDAEIEDPPGGRFLRDSEGEPTGVLIDKAMDMVAGDLPAPSAEELRRRIEVAAEHAVSVGLTTVTDMGIGEEVYQAYRDLHEAGRLPLRAALFLTDDAELLAEWFRRGPQLSPDHRLLVRGVKLYADGALGSRGAALIEPYSDDPDNLGLLTSSEEHMAEVARRALVSGFQVGVHAIGDRGSLVALDAIERAFGEPRPDARFRLEHAQVMRLQDIDRMVALGVIASMQPTHATSDMPWAGDRVGEERLEGAYAWRKVLEAGGRLALGSDFPVESADPRLGLYAAITRQDLDGRPEGGWLPGERLGAREALRGFTLDAAYSLFLEREVGSLTPGKRADLVVFARDILTVPAEEIPRVEVDMTFVEGELVYRREGGR